MTHKALHHPVLSATQTPLCCLVCSPPTSSVSLIHWVDPKPFALIFSSIWNTLTSSLKELAISHHSKMSTQISLPRDSNLILPYTSSCSLPSCYVIFFWAHVTTKNCQFDLFICSLSLCTKFNSVRVPPWPVLLAIISPLPRTVSDIQKLFINVCPVN